jgi:carbonic anhydrase
MNRRTLLFGFGLLGATALSGGGTVYALTTLGMTPKAPPPEKPEPTAQAAPPAHGTSASKPTPNAAGGRETHPPAAAGGEPHWGYEGPTGPEKWAEMDPANAVCKLGGAQSPVDLTNPLRVAALAGLQVEYASTRVKITNNGHTFQINVDKGSSLKIDGKRFDLLQFHFHTPSEHTLDGKPFPLELHLVHQAADKTLAVIGVLMTEGTTNTVLGRFWERLPRSQGEVDSGVTIDIKDLLPRATDEYFTYSGSLTTPPCTESVRWIVLKQPIQVSKSQIATFKSVFPMNARPTVPLGARYLLSS